MAREFARTDRVSDAIKRELSQIIQQEMRDPRVGMVNINDVEVSRDLSAARVFVTFVGVQDDAKSLEATKILNKASGFLRALLSKAVLLRITPHLKFIYDSTTIRGQELSALIDKAVEVDRHFDDEADSADKDQKDEA